MVYNASNLTGLQTAEDFYGIIEYTNYTTNGIMVLMLSIVVFFILLSLFMRRSDFESSLMASSFISFVLSIMLSAINLLNPIFVLLYLALFAFTVFFIKVVGRQ